MITLTPTPVLETDRLTLRAPQLSDWQAVRAFGLSERSMFIGGPFSEAQIWTSLLASAGHWAMRGYGMWTIEDKQSGAAIGRTGIINHFDWPEPELGWQIFEGAEGRGLAYEAAMAARSHAATGFGLSRVISQIHPDNTRSRRLAERMGAVVEREGEVRGTPCLIYRHPAEVTA
ncbi:MAG: GNAT family N-acetyltransferase [Paracoccus sp. (in: a-proteobacteria)]